MVLPSRMLPHSIDILSPAQATDAYGNTVEDWATPTIRAVRAYVRPAPASETIADRNAVTAVWQVHTNDLDVTALERVRFDGVVYAIDGQPLTWRTKPGGGRGHTKLLLRRVDG